MVDVIQKLLFKPFSMLIPKRAVVPVSVTAAGSVRTAARLLEEGEVIAIPTDTVYGFACSARNTEAISRLYSIKGRHESKPLALCLGDVKQIPLWGDISHLPNGLLDALLPGPVTIIVKSIVCQQYVTSNNKVGIRVPNYAFSMSIANALGCPVALTSANLSSEPSCVNVNEFSALWPKLAAIFDGGALGSENNRKASTVVDLSSPGRYYIVRSGMAADDTVAILKQFGLTDDS